MKRKCMLQADQSTILHLYPSSFISKMYVFFLRWSEVATSYFLVCFTPLSTVFLLFVSELFYLLCSLQEGEARKSGSSCQSQSAH